MRRLWVSSLTNFCSHWAMSRRQLPWRDKLGLVWKVRLIVCLSAQPANLKMGERVTDLSPAIRNLRNSLRVNWNRELQITALQDYPLQSVVFRSIQSFYDFSNTVWWNQSWSYLEINNVIFAIKSTLTGRSIWRRQATNSNFGFFSLPLVLQMWYTGGASQTRPEHSTVLIKYHAKGRQAADLIWSLAVEIKQ